MTDICEHGEPLGSADYCRGCEQEMPGRSEDWLTLWVRAHEGLDVEFDQEEGLARFAALVGEKVAQAIEEIEDRDRELAKGHSPTMAQAHRHRAAALNKAARIAREVTGGGS